MQKNIGGQKVWSKKMWGHQILLTKISGGKQLWGQILLVCREIFGCVKERSVTLGGSDDPPRHRQIFMLVLQFLHSKSMSACVRESAENFLLGGAASFLGW